MRRCRIKLPNRCYHLISRVAHRAYFLDEDERTRLVDFVRRVAEFSGVKLLAYSVMSNHFHVFVYIGRPESLSDAEIVRRISALYSDVRFERVMKKWNELAKRPDRRGKTFAAGIETPGYIPQVIAKGDDVRAVRLMQLLQWEPKSPAYLRTTMTRKTYCGNLLWQTGLVGSRQDAGFAPCLSVASCRIARRQARSRP